MKSNSNAGKELRLTHRKGNKDFTILKKIARQQWAKGPQTMKQVATATGIVREHLCRFTDEWRKEGTMFIHQIGPCPITGWSGVMFLALCSRNSLAGLNQRLLGQKKGGV